MGWIETPLATYWSRCARSASVRDPETETAMGGTPGDGRFTPPSISAGGFPRPLLLVALASLSNTGDPAWNERTRMSTVDHRRLQDAAKQHLMMHFTRQGAYRTEDVPVITHGEGCWL